MMNAEQISRMFQLFEAVREGIVSEEQLAELDQILAENKEACRYYLEYFNMCVLLKSGKAFDQTFSAIPEMNDSLRDMGFWRAMAREEQTAPGMEIPAGRIKTRDNAYVSCTGTIYPGRDTVFTPSYAYTIDAVADVPAIVSAGAGNRLYGDFNGDGRVDAEDLYLFSDFWLDDSNRAAFYQDLNGDGQVNFYEFVSFAGHWLQTY